ncbi:MarR family winged helix-turn-helix transcriptional regulator [Streptomyces genisteinicus]|uniref:Winged helix-turn-helix transcriptional regulator n=1 Tax=Streptomyces genisteinicus TaxID=2768068 RepID=A0A7H0HUA0_9ACTN|nr:MarR family winged helix-turn-helix transcriptional regulator [Streptomyces genisteinicus]QNP64116.1 winged helix-turn-helix transcriptional regulator [Streptomyces genisteinicus]
MAERSQFEELARQLSAVGAVKRSLARILPADCPSGAAAVLSLTSRYGEMRMGRLAELLAVDMSVTSRHVAHVVDRGWLERLPDPDDRRSRILRLTPAGEELMEDLGRRTTDMFAHHLGDWSDEDVGRLNELLARLRESVGDCRAHTPRAPARQTS